MIIDLVVVLLHLVDVFFVMVLKLRKSFHKLALQQFKPVMILVFNRLVLLVVLRNAVIALFRDFVQLFLELVDVALDLLELLFVRAYRLVPEVVVVHPIVVLEQSVTRERAFFDSIVLAMPIIEMVVLPALMMLHAHIDDVNRVVIHEDVHVVDMLVQLEQIVCAQVQVDLRPAAQVRVLHERQIFLNLLHVELIERLDEVTVLHLVADGGENFVDSVISLLLRHLF